MTPSCRPCGQLQRIPWSRRGAVLVEFALILPLFMLLLIGTLEFARAFEVWQVVVHLTFVASALLLAVTDRISSVTAVETRVKEH